MVKVYSGTDDYYDFMKVRKIYCNSHDTEEEDMKDSEYGFSLFVIYTHAHNDVPDFATMIAETDCEGDRSMQYLGGWIVV